jgi:hypothetical protein
VTTTNDNASAIRNFIFGLVVPEGSPGLHKVF